MKIKSIIYLFLSMIFMVPVFSQNQKTLLIKSDQVLDLSINGKLSINKLFYPGSSFESLEPLGTPIDTSYERTPVEEIFVFVYEGYQLTFSTLNGSPELTEISLTGEKASINLNSISLKPGVKPEELLDSDTKARRNLPFDVHLIKDQDTINKFGDHWSYLEIILDKNDEIERIEYKRNIL